MPVSFLPQILWFYSYGLSLFVLLSNIGQLVLLVNLSHVSAKPTGLSNYATNVVPYIQSLKPTLLSSFGNILEGECYSIPSEMGPEYGARGHMKRLAWTQYALPRVCKRLNCSLLFSPIPEAPLFSSIRYVVTAHDLIPLRFAPRASRLRLYFRYYVSSVLKSAEHILCNSQATAKEIVDFYGFPKSKTTVIPLAHNDRCFKPLNLPPKNYFLYIGRHDVHKNLTRLVEAFAKVAKQQDCELWLVGSQHQKYTPQVHQRAEELAIAEKVRIMDYLPENQLNVVMNEAIALVFPSLWEGFGLPVLEAMACGTPVITSNLSALPEAAGDAALLINPYKVNDLAEAMRQVATDSQLRYQLREAGLKRSQQFSWRKTGQLTAEVLQRFL